MQESQSINMDNGWIKGFFLTTLSQLGEVSVAFSVMVYVTESPQTRSWDVHLHLHPAEALPGLPATAASSTGGPLSAEGLLLPQEQQGTSLLAI